MGHCDKCTDGGALPVGLELGLRLCQNRQEILAEWSLPKRDVCVSQDVVPVARASLPQCLPDEESDFHTGEVECSSHQFTYDVVQLQRLS